MQLKSYLSFVCDENQLIKDYQSGKSLRELARAYGASKQILKKRLQKYGVYDPLRVYDFRALGRVRHPGGVPAAPPLGKVVITRLGLSALRKPRRVVSVEARCDSCGAVGHMQKRSLRLAMRKHGRYLCLRCIMARRNEAGQVDRKRLTATGADPSTRSRISQAIKRMWQAGFYRDRKAPLIDRVALARKSKAAMTPDRRARLAEAVRHLWRDQQWRARHAIGAAMAMTPALRKQRSDNAKRMWRNPVYRAKFSRFLASKQDSSVLERIANKIVTDMGFRPYKLTHGGWTFDVAVDLAGRKGLLVEVQGEYVHSLPMNANRDALKRDYFARHLSARYELRYLYERDFYAMGKVRGQLADWLGVVDRVEQIDFASIELAQDAKAFDFIQAYHYLSTKRGGIPIVARLGETVVAACIFSPPVRLECAARLGLEPRALLELSRFCINPKYQVRNLGSWFLARAMGHVRRLVPAVKAFITWADTTMGHDGTLYKAVGFTYDGRAPATYWYVDAGGHWFHKKSVWNQASRNKSTEAEWAAKHGLVKIKGQALLRFIKLV
jgi:GNAT superfamily N-acetyltransferase